MNGNLQTTATIRQRGQLTIPDEIRGAKPWLNTNAIVIIKTTPADELLIKPFYNFPQGKEDKKTNWKKIWEGVELARSFKGKRGNLSKFIAEDRERH